MSDLIKQLRLLGERSSADGRGSRICDEAADALEAAYFRIAELEAKCRLYEASLDKSDGRIAELEEQITAANGWRKDAERYRFLAASAFKHLLPTAETIDAAIAKEPK